ncbi:MAG: metalloregulator ArsR/SmtB family transcription factor [Firmicutes bacterium]|nr:metalloregulator ArsR/SmtB family transcription factor [Bacillota bacterium]
MDNVKIAQALSDPIRYKIMMLLIRSETACCPVMGSNDGEFPVGLCNCEIMNELSMIQSRVSYHMKELVETGLVNEEPRGRWKYYFANRSMLLAYVDQLKQDFNLE